MPLDPAKKDAVRANLEQCANGEKPKPIDIGSLTQVQFAAINVHRSRLNLPSLESAVVVYVGRHHYESRSKDGYTIEDMIAQLEFGLSEHSVVITSPRMTQLQNQQGRQDGYGNHVKDIVVLELSTRKPKSEAFSVIPKGDKLPL